METNTGIEVTVDMMSGPQGLAAKKMLEKLFDLDGPGDMIDDTLRSVINHMVESDATYGQRNDTETIENALFNSFRKKYPDPWS